GFVPCTPLLPKRVFQVQLLQFYHHLVNRCPRVAAQAFVKALCDVRAVPYEPNWAQQFSTAYDVYLAIIQQVRTLVRKSLHRSSPDWRILNACPACQIRVVGEKVLPVRMMVAIDGNNSLKRIARRDPPSESGILGKSRERSDPRDGGQDGYLTTEEVEEWDEKKWKYSGNDMVDSEDESECNERWKNMKEESTAVALGKYEETGLFIMLCRHGFVLSMADMVRSGEQRKYALAVLNRFLSAEKRDREEKKEPKPAGELLVGYDIGCETAKTVKRCPLCPLALDQKLRMVVGLMHGHAHNRLCQLCYLLLYVVGAGLEDLEGCERFFSKSNSLAGKTRYQSRFHRRQAISEYTYHNDNFEVYANLSDFLVNNYRQALDLVATQDVLVEQLRLAEIEDTRVFFSWLDEERQYLRSREKVPVRETLEMEYLRNLKELEICRGILSTRTEEFLGWTVDTSKRELDALERNTRHLREEEMKHMRNIHVLKQKLEIDKTWERGSDEWERVDLMTQNANYQKALDHLEGLLVSRIFELGKAHLAGTGYKMRQHLLNAIRNRSKAIQTAIEKYNDAAKALRPPRRTISWDEIMDYTFLSEFDILRDTRDDVRHKPWAQPANRQLSNQFFKILRAQEELERLHVEIQRLYTFMKEETQFLLKAEQILKAKDPAFANQVRGYRMERGRFNEIHRRRLEKI
ncbi:hypothetical protein K435DRAFT_600997, partial [Dendrothele bispora CBS 962.96]